MGVFVRIQEFDKIRSEFHCGVQVLPVKQVFQKCLKFENVSTEEHANVFFAYFDQHTVILLAGDVRHEAFSKLMRKACTYLK
jgi:hypothetical protein